MSASFPTFAELVTAAQYLSQIRHWPPTKQLRQFGARPHPISLKSLQLLLVQSVYLIFYLTDNYPHAKCFLSRDLWVASSESQEEDLVFLLTTPDNSANKLEAALAAFVEKESVCVCGREGEVIWAMRGRIEACLEAYKESRAKGYILPLRLNEAIIKTEMDEFCYVYCTVLTPKLAAFAAPATFLRALEETRLFRENALLLKYSNHSLLAKIIPLQKCKDDLQDLAAEFEAERLQFLKNPIARVPNSEELIERFLIMLSFAKVITLNASLNEGQEPEAKQEGKGKKVGKVVEGQSPEGRALVLSFNVEESPYQFLTPQRLDHLLANPTLDRFPEENTPANRRLSEFELRYSAIHNQFDLRLLTCHPVRQQEVDLTAAVLASLSEAVPDLNHSFEESARKLKAGEKYIALRRRAQLHPKECPFAQVLQAVDALIADSLVLEHDLRTRRPVGPRRINQIKEVRQYMLDRVGNLAAILADEPGLL